MEFKWRSGTKIFIFYSVSVSLHYPFKLFLHYLSTSFVYCYFREIWYRNHSTQEQKQAGESMKYSKDFECLKSLVNYRKK